MNNSLSEYNKFCIIAEMHNVVYKNTNSFNIGELGSSLSYLTIAIVNDNICSLDADNLLIQLLQILLPKDHDVWDFIKIESDVDNMLTTIHKIALVRCNLCDCDVAIQNATFSPSLAGWLGKFCCLNKNIK